MSAVQWARTLRCDYPECQSEADVRSPDDTPAGWLSLTYRGNMEISDAWGRKLTDLCSLHASVPVDKLAAVMRGLLTQAAL